MAKWNVGLNTPNSTLKGTFEYESGKRTGESTFKIYQDEKPFLEQAKYDRETQKTIKGFKKFATIPDIVAIEIADRYGINIHDPSFGHDIDKKKRFMRIIKEEFPHLLAY